MSYGTYLRFHQKSDVYSKSVSVNSAGQKLGSWSLSKSSIPCTFQPSASEKRTNPYVTNVDEYDILVPHTYASYFSYGFRVKDIKDRYGNVIVEGPFEIIEIVRRTGWNGKLSHILIRIRLVVEDD